MSRYALNLPAQLKKEAEYWALKQGVSLNQFILWAVAERVGGLKQQLDDPNFPKITYRRSASGHPVPTLRSSGIRVKSLVAAHQDWGLSIKQIASEYDISPLQVKEAITFYKDHQQEIDSTLADDQRLETERGET